MASFPVIRNESVIFELNSSVNGTVWHQYILASNDDVAFQRYKLPLSFIIPLIMLYGIVITISIGGNFLVFWTISSVKALRTVTNFFLASLCISDITMTIICIPSTILSNIIFQYWILGPALCPVIQYIQLVVVLQRTFAMVAITCDRHFVISKPLRKRMSKKKARLLITCLWLISMTIAMPTALNSQITYLQYEPGVYGLCVEVWESYQLRYIYSVTILLLQYFLPLLIMTCAYIHIGYMIWIKQIPGEADRERDRRIAMSKRKSLKMLFIVVAVYGITWLPLHILTIFGDIYPETFNYMFAHCLWLFFHWLAFSNSGINPIIYCWINKTFRSRFYRVCCIDSCHHGRLSRTYRKAILFGDDKNSSRNVKNGKFILITIKDDYSDFTSPESERKYVNCKSKKNNCLKMTSI